MKIKVKYTLSQTCHLEINGNWIDLKSSENIYFKAPYLNDRAEILFDVQKVSLGISMELPKNFEAIVIARSSLFKKYKLMLVNSIGLIDSGITPDRIIGVETNDKAFKGYCGNSDIWSAQLMSFSQTAIKQGESICQFRIQPSMSANWWTKLKWLFNSKIEFIEVNNLTNVNRGSSSN